MKPNKNSIEVYGKNYFGYYSTTRIACRGIVIHDEDLLLVHAVNGDVWMIPGGGQEEGESEEDCVARELSEETGCVVKPMECLLEIDEYYENERYISKYYRCDIAGQSAIRLTEFETKVGLEAKWISIEEAIAIFSRHRNYAKEDEVKRGIYLREYLALRRIAQGK